MDRDAVGIVRPRELGRVAPVDDERDLRGGERHDLCLGIAAVDGVEVVEVATRGSHDQDASLRHGALLRSWVRENSDARRRTRLGACAPWRRPRSSRGAYPTAAGRSESARSQVAGPSDRHVPPSSCPNGRAKCGTPTSHRCSAASARIAVRAAAPAGGSTSWLDGQLGCAAWTGRCSRSPVSSTWRAPVVHDDAAMPRRVTRRVDDAHAGRDLAVGRIGVEHAELVEAGELGYGRVRLVPVGEEGDVGLVQHVPSVRETRSVVVPDAPGVIGVQVREHDEVDRLDVDPGLGERLVRPASRARRPRPVRAGMNRFPCRPPSSSPVARRMRARATATTSTSRNAQACRSRSADQSTSWPGHSSARSRAAYPWQTTTISRFSTRRDSTWLTAAHPGSRSPGSSTSRSVVRAGSSAVHVASSITATRIASSHAAQRSLPSMEHARGRSPRPARADHHGQRPPALAVVQRSPRRHRPRRPPGASRGAPPSTCPACRRRPPPRRPDRPRPGRRARRRAAPAPRARPSRTERGRRGASAAPARRGASTTTTSPVTSASRSTAWCSSGIPACIAASLS